MGEGHKLQSLTVASSASGTAMLKRNDEVELLRKHSELGSRDLGPS